jgi:Plasmid pRiA4b ORF-3-like protein
VTGSRGITAPLSSIFSGVYWAWWKPVNILHVNIEDDYFHKDDRLVRLAHIAPKKGATFLYEYDFGDSWKHEITVEDISSTPKDEPPYPWCLDGQRACPPEDVGGVSGYAHFLEAWRKRSHPEHQQMRQWVGKHFRPELFSVQQVNAGLALFISLSSKS